ncbi:hypothetical protein CAPTEDRAFT_224296 [Capitella teleta]|uniref:Apple domain-containing protein n=1 Tax=Capitella teleta TaxID=283909 RepID=R7TZ64_CAPTE|nr:hypothetical protein CAPTEDRAFT_224296 [Capitella teleta]|eukprot:ELT99223.1 hypothetical protein CAPTEDRAFT_224296 [Capitella teleta]
MAGFWGKRDQLSATMHLKQLAWILLCASGLRAQGYIISDVFSVKNDVGLKSLNYSAIASFAGVSEMYCVLVCATNPCCLSVFWAPQPGNGNCLLYDAQFIAEFLIKKVNTVQFTRREAHPRRSEFTSWVTKWELVLNGYDQDKSRPHGIEDCKARCHRQVWCISFDLTRSGCYLSRVNARIVDNLVTFDRSSYNELVCHA